MKLVWKGRSWEPGAPLARARASKSDASPAPRAPNVQILERAGDGADRLIQGDALDVASALEAGGLAGKVQLAYVDPPYFSQADYEHEARLDGGADGRVRRSAAYRDRWAGGEGEGLSAYLDMLAPRLEAVARLLAPEGTLWVQLDWRAAYLARVLLDEIFGRAGFKNEIVWRRAPNLGRQAASGQFGRTLDTLLVYGGPGARLVPPTRLEPIAESAVRWDAEGRPFTTAPRGDYTDASVAKLDAEGRIHRAASGKVYVKYFLVKDASGTLCRERRVDALWTDVAPLRHAQPRERTGYPTQKPLSLLERIVASATQPGDLVVDVFGGSGTTGEAAFRLGRRFVLGDGASLAIATARARLLRAGASFRVEACAAAAPAFGEPPDVRVERVDAGTLDVRLESPREPLAWAIDLDPGAAAPFAIGWHAERQPGAKTIAAPRVARVRTDADRIAIRVFEDDGTIRRGTFAVPAGAPSPRKRSMRGASAIDDARAATRPSPKTPSALTCRSRA
jgi:DNA modification methylase